MTELADLISVFGAVDDAVVGAGMEKSGEARRPSPAVAALLPAYGSGAAGWFSRLKGANSLDGLAEAGIKTLPAALASLAEESDGREGEPDHLTVRRLLGIALVSRLQAESGPWSLGSQQDTDDLLERALVPVVTGGAAGNAEGRAHGLLALLRDDDKLYPDVASWQPMMHDGFRNGFVDAGVAGLLMVPATWGVVPAPGGGPAVWFETHFRLSSANVNDALTILDPSTWTNCTPPWCTMSGSPLPAPGPATYLETVAIYCSNLLAPLLSFTTPLNCRRDDLPSGQGGILEYRLGDITQGDRRVTVDEGSVVVTVNNSQIDILSTKRVQFGGLRWMSSLEAAELAQLVWTFGYSSLAEFTVNRIIANGGRGRLIGGVGPGTVGAGSQTLRTGKAGSSGEDVLQAIEDALQECVTATRTSWAKMAMGAYGPEEYTADLRKATGHVVRHGSNVLRAVSKLGSDSAAEG